MERNQQKELSEFNTRRISYLMMQRASIMRMATPHQHSTYTLDTVYIIDVKEMMDDATGRMADVIYICIYIYI